MLMSLRTIFAHSSQTPIHKALRKQLIHNFMTQQLTHETKEELIERFLKDRKEQHKELQSAKFKIESLEDKIKKLQQKNDLLQLDFNAAQEIMGGMNKEIWELKKQNKSWQEMVDSTNQTNQALCKRLK